MILGIRLTFLGGGGGRAEVPGRGIEPTPQLRPEPQQWQPEILNSLHHQGTPHLLFRSLRHVHLYNGGEGSNRQLLPRRSWEFSSQIVSARGKSERWRQSALAAEQSYPGSRPVPMTTWPATFPGRWLRHFLSVYFRVRARDAVAVLQTLKQDSAASLLTLRPSTSSSAAGGYRLLPGPARSRSTASIWTRLRQTSLPS